MFLPASAALGCGLAEARPDELLVLEAREGRVHGTEARRAAGAPLDLLADADAVAVVAEAREGEEDELLELTGVRGQTGLLFLPPYGI